MPTGLASTTLGNPTFSYGNNQPDTNFDANGNRTTDGTNQLYYDGENRISAIGSTIHYAYDEQGRRFKKKLDGGDTTYYLYGLTGLMSEFSTNSTVSDHTCCHFNRPFGISRWGANGHGSDASCI